MAHSTSDAPSDGNLPTAQTGEAARSGEGERAGEGERSTGAGAPDTAPPPRGGARPGAVRSAALQKLVRAEHRRLAKLATICAEGDTAARDEAVRALAPELRMQMKTRWAVLYPTLAEAGVDTDVIAEAQVGEEIAHHLLEGLAEGAPTDGLRGARTAFLGRLVQRRIASEQQPRRGLLAAMAAARIDGGELAHRLREQRAALEKEASHDAAAPLLAPSIHHEPGFAMRAREDSTEDSTMAHDRRERDDRRRFVSNDEFGGRGDRREDDYGNRYREPHGRPYGDDDHGRRYGDDDHGRRYGGYDERTSGRDRADWDERGGDPGWDERRGIGGGYDDRRQGPERRWDARQGWDARRGIGGGYGGRERYIGGARDDWREERRREEREGWDVHRGWDERRGPGGGYGGGYGEREGYGRDEDRDRDRGGYGAERGGRHRDEDRWSGERGRDGRSGMHGGRGGDWSEGQYRDRPSGEGYRGRESQGHGRPERDEHRDEDRGFSSRARYEEGRGRPPGEHGGGYEGRGYGGRGYGGDRGRGDRERGDEERGQREGHGGRWRGDDEYRDRYRR